MKVMMIGRADNHRINLRFHLLQHHPVVFKLSGFRKSIEHARSAILIDIAQGDDVLGRHSLNIARRLSSSSDRCDVQSLVRRVRARRPGLQDRKRRGRRSCGSKKVTSVCGFAYHTILPLMGGIYVS